MGTVYSLKKDYNRVLATQEPQPVLKPSIESASHHGEQTLEMSLTISDFPPFRPSTIDNPTTPPDDNNNKFGSIKISERESTDSQIRKTPLAIEREEIPSTKLNNTDTCNNLSRSSSSILSTEPTQQQTRMLEDIHILSRSIVNLYPKPSLTNSDPKRFQLNRLISDHNGKKYISEFHTRAEQRYVQWFDPASDRLRFFEVIDYIPTKTVRPLALNTLSTGTRRSLGPSLGRTVNGVAGEGDIGVKPLESRNKNSEILSTHSSISSLNKQRASRNSNSVSSSSSELTRFQNETPKRQNVIPLPPPPKTTTDNAEYPYNQYEEPGMNNRRSMRTQNTLASSYNSSTSSDSTIAGLNRTSDSNATKSRTSGQQQFKPSYASQRSASNYTNGDQTLYEENEEYNGNASIDPFARTTGEGTYYHRRRTGNKYSEPLRLYGRIQPNEKPDYTPIRNNTTLQN